MKHAVLDGCLEHEQVHFFQDDESGLNALIAIHNTTLGTTLGGCRMWPYDTFETAVKDVLRLSAGMTYKCAMAGLPVGGGKSVIIGDPIKDKNHEKLKAMARAINHLDGLYTAAEDSGTSVRDMKVMQLYTPHIAGIQVGSDRIWEQNYGDPSPATAYGTFKGIQASVSHKFSQNTLSGLKINVQGLGNVGARLVKYLVEAGATVRVHDAIATRERDLVSKFGVEALTANEIINRPADIFCPCALGAVINEETVEQLDVAIVAGAANNQLASDRQGQRLLERNILYAPDFVINAGGIIDASMTKMGADSDSINDRVNKIENTLINIYKRADIEHMPTHLIAEEIAKEKIICHRESGFQPELSVNATSDRSAQLHKTNHSNYESGRNLIEEVAKRFKVPNAYL